MDGIDLVLTARRPDVIAGESVVVVTELVNHGGAPFAMQGSSVQSPFAFEARALDGGDASRTLSQRNYREWLDGLDRRPPRDLGSVSLAPGEKLSTVEDLALYAAGSLSPGRYELLARYETDAVSKPVALRVDAPSMGPVASLYCPLREALCTVFEDRRAAVVLQRTTLSVNPDNGVFYRCPPLPDEGLRDDVSLTIHLDTACFGRWCAWVDGSALTAVWSLEDEFVRAPVVELGASVSVLARPGFQSADQAALFVTASAEPGGAVARFHHLTHRGAYERSSPLCASLPSRVLARYGWQEGEARLHLVWAEHDESSTRVFRRTYRNDGAPIDDAPVLLCARDAPLAALELSSLEGVGSSRVHCLLGPDPRDGRMTRLDFALDPGEAPRACSIDPPAAPVQWWAIACSTTESSPVLAWAPPDLLWTYAPGDAPWSVLAQGLPTLDHLALFAPPEGPHQAEWCDPARGIVHAALPLPPR